jgi:hypothetical protein
MVQPHFACIVVIDQFGQGRGSSVEGRGWSALNPAFSPRRRRIIFSPYVNRRLYFNRSVFAEGEMSGRQRTEDRGRRTEPRGQRTDIGGRRSDFCLLASGIRLLPSELWRRGFVEGFWFPTSDIRLPASGCCCWRFFRHSQIN